MRALVGAATYYAAPEPHPGCVLGSRRTNPVRRRATALPVHDSNAARYGRAPTNTR